MFYQVRVGVTGVTTWHETNLSREEVLEHWLCPFLAKEPCIIKGTLFNMSTFGSLRVFSTERVVDSEWPVSKAEYKDNDGSFQWYKYDPELRRKIEEKATDVTTELTRDALVLLESGKWKDRIRLQIERDKGRFCFFICPFGNDEVDHNYRFVISPVVRQYGFEIKRVDELSH